jgi:ppGpp synthetase/RelA/SpoT-type nucleotidyltranferase
MNRDELRLAYDERLHRLESLESEAGFAVRHALAATPIKLHSITSRVKTFESFARKVDSKNLEAPFEEIRDLVGLRIVCLFLSDIQPIGKVVRQVFDIKNEDNKIEGGQVSSFGYMSVHFDCEMKSSYSGPRYDTVRGLPLEIQVRTLAMDAWANVSHHLSYRSDVDVPEDLRRDFYALSGLFYVADKHFEVFYRASYESRRETVAAFESESLEQLSTELLNVDTLAGYLRAKFADRNRTDPSAISELLNDLLGWGARTIGDVDRVLEATNRAFTEYEKDHPPQSRRFSDVGVVRISFHLYDAANYKVTHEKTLGTTSRKSFEHADSQYKPYRKFVLDKKAL